MTTFTSDDREEAEKRQKIMNDLQKQPDDWEEASAPWPFDESDILDGEE